MHNTSDLLDSKLLNPLRPLYLIHGEEELLRVEAIDTLRTAAKAQGYLNRQVFSSDSNDFDWQAVLANTNSAGLFADLKLLEIHIPNGKVGKVGADILINLAQIPPEHTVIIVVLPKLERAQNQSKWFTTLSKYAIIAEAKPINLHALPAWLNQRLKQHHLEMDADALALFAQRVEGNLLAAKHEIEKLALLYPEGTCLNIKQTEQAVADVARFDIFQLTEAWMSGNTVRLIRLLENLQTDDEEPVLPLWALAEDIRMLIRLSAAIKQGQSAHSVRNELKLWGNKLQYAPQAATRLKPTRLIKALQECAHIDRIIKGAEDGNAWETFKHLISNLAA